MPTGGPGPEGKTALRKGLIIFARKPAPGAVKTRLARDVGAPAAAELYSAMLADILGQAGNLPGIRPLLFWACDDDAIPSCPALPVLETFPQTGTTLGSRMEAAFQHAFQSGLEACCIIGTDSPDLPPDYIMQAFALLELGDTDAVFGPADDGGYYLLGLRQVRHGLFTDIPWSTSGVLEASLSRSRELGLQTSLLPTWYDIDTLPDLERLMASPGRSAPRTRQAAGRILTPP